MQASPSTTALLASLDAFSGNKLTRREDLAVLIDVATRTGRIPLLEELSFFAKFVSKAYGIMTRVGKDGEGYETVAREFRENLEKVKTLAGSLLEDAHPDVQHRFAETYFGMTTTSLQNLLALLYDLSWYKNWIIEHPRQGQ